MLIGVRHQSGFTVVELLVAMFVLAMVLVVISTGIVNGLSGASKSAKERQAIQNVDRTTKSLQSTLRTLRSPDRDEAVVSDTNALSAALLQGASISGRRTAGAASVTLDVNDITYADGNRLVVRSDVLPQAGVECVEYVVVTLTGGTRRLDRRVWLNTTPTAPPTCPAAGAPSVTETLISTVGTG